MSSILPGVVGSAVLLGGVTYAQPQMSQIMERMNSAAASLIAGTWPGDKGEDLILGWVEARREAINDVVIEKLAKCGNALRSQEEQNLSEKAITWICKPFGIDLNQSDFDQVGFSKIRLGDKGCYRIAALIHLLVGCVLLACVSAGAAACTGGKVASNFYSGLRVGRLVAVCLVARELWNAKLGTQGASSS